MTSLKYEVVIPAHQKDYTKLRYVIDRVILFTDCSAIRIITPDPEQLKTKFPSIVTVHSDSDVLPFDKSLFRHRSSWVYQQFLKLFQEITETSWFIGMDADLFLNKRYPVFDENDNPIMVLARDPGQFISQYFEFNKAMLGIGREFNSNLLSDATLYNRDLIDEMLATNNYTKESFLLRAALIIGGGCFPADAEVYGQWVWANYPKLYKTVRLNNAMNGLYGLVYTEKMIEDVLKANGGANIDTISMHSWSI